ncbi:type II toxin-antitoxin system HipA family toxin [Rhodobacter sp. NSM]|uniref:type II toxin-antitoxin system HipA family toxin n=1 Tax=Rhodobacter sp. NSM TaxID=3457501 RepID=UPI003FD1A618
MIAKIVEVWLDWEAGLVRLGRMRRQARAGGEILSFAYDAEWIAHPMSFAVDPRLPLTPGEFFPDQGQVFGTIGDSAPDRWGKDLMRRRERRAAVAEGRRPRALQEVDFLLGVADVSRLGAMRFREEGSELFVADVGEGVPGTIDLGRLLAASDRIQADDFADEDLRMIFAPGSSLGGARPKASVLDATGNLMIAKFPKADDEHDIETWEAIALTLAARAGIRVAPFELKSVGGRRVLLSRRFDRAGGHRLPFISAMALTGHRDGDDDCSYLEMAEVIDAEGAEPEADRIELFRRIAFSILISNVDDHLRNHGFIRQGAAGWRLSPAYDLNPVPPHLKPAILSTAIDYDDRTADVGLLLETAGEYGIRPRDARTLLRDTAQVIGTWREVAAELGARAAEIREMEGAFEHERREATLSL